MGRRGVFEYPRLVVCFFAEIAGNFVYSASVVNTGDLTTAKAVNFLEQSRYPKFAVELNDPSGSFIQIHPVAVTYSGRKLVPRLTARTAGPSWKSVFAMPITAAVLSRAS